MTSEQIVKELMVLAAYYGGHNPQPDDRIYADLDINGSDFIEFIEEVEHRYGVDLSWVTPRDKWAEPQDPTIKALAEDISRQRL